MLSQPKNMIGLYVKSIRDTFEASLSDNGKLWNRSKSKRWNCVSQAVMSLQFCQPAMKRVTFITCYVWQSFSPRTWMRACFSDFTSQLQANRVDEELFRKYKLSELGLFAVHYKDWTRLSLETLRCSSWMTSYINYIMKILFEFLHLKISQQH